MFSLLYKVWYEQGTALIASVAVYKMLPYIFSFSMFPLEGWGWGGGVFHFLVPPSREVRTENYIANFWTLVLCNSLCSTCEFYKINCSALIALVINFSITKRMQSVSMCTLAANILADHKNWLLKPNTENNCIYVVKVKGC